MLCLSYFHGRFRLRYHSNCKRISSPRRHLIDHWLPHCPCRRRRARKWSSIRTAEILGIYDCRRRRMNCSRCRPWLRRSSSRQPAKSIRKTLRLRPLLNGGQRRHRSKRRRITRHRRRHSRRRLRSPHHNRRNVIVRHIIIPIRPPNLPQRRKPIHIPKRPRLKRRWLRRGVHKRTWLGGSSCKRIGLIRRGERSKGGFSAKGRGCGPAEGLS